MGSGHRELARGSGRCPTLRATRCRVVGSGFKVVLDAMNAERALIAAECIGDGRWFVEKVCSVPLADSVEPFLLFAA